MHLIINVFVLINRNKINLILYIGTLYDYLKNIYLYLNKLQIWEIRQEIFSLDLSLERNDITKASINNCNLEF